MNNVSKCLKECVRYDEGKKFAISCCQMPGHAKTRAHARVRVFLCAKCLKWPETYAKWIWDDLKHFFFFARANARTYECSRVFWPETDRTDIDPNHDKYKWEMPFRYEDMIMSKKYQKKNTKWRLDDVMKTSWPWKCPCHVLWQWPMTVPKLNEIY